MAQPLQDSNKELQEELQDDYVGKQTTTGTAVGIGVGAIAGGGIGVAVGAEAGAALVIGGSVISAPVAVPALIGAAAVGAVAYGVSNVYAKNAKIDALEKDGLKQTI
eukprot:CAMPEP_0201576926 /NCGR_PEP_ID=MMETSP0190_2-20130828/23043_1 /ASSEMBLY_ACC=CAM_ASM_000263 /TAXON_ID=37353 /ORGANISM="Rosalina sp." /LENGTH=106 /DNA_ID=CAMNT_0048008379 /DNA_START=19 /DNA_END=336 /DNA_ORIENTATION=+